MAEKYESLDELFEDEEFEVSEESEDNVPLEVKSRLALALDVDDLIDARRLAGSLFDFFGTVKVGLELYAAAGPDSVGVFTEAGFDVFCDLKLHDIPTTVHKAARVVGSVGARWVTAHAAGGEEMLKAAVDGLKEGAESVGLPTPGVLGVTVLTSDSIKNEETILLRCETALKAGCEGIICAAPDLQATSSFSEKLIRVVPGLRLAGANSHDQVRVATPMEAISGGADMLVIGRMVTEAENPIEASEELVSELLG
ncbi:MAG: orotidine-5'-phosphate decarboxylase [Actinomycetota bacterium]|nr:orotidine-5'-phosphate decarboxylase [Actinomycetota bacterium]|tara:strand:- start:9 stop:773 length:765 start_codon:yes stop_codon:yes gene_type:complete